MTDYTMDHANPATETDAADPSADLIADLTECPAVLSELDPSAALRWPTFLRKTGIPMSTESEAHHRQSFAQGADPSGRSAPLRRKAEID